MALIDSSGSGTYWDESVAWSGGVPPVLGVDTVRINTGHLLRVRNTMSHGTSPADTTTNVLQLLGQLIIDQGVTFDMRGNWVQGGSTGSNGVLTVRGNLRVDGSAATQEYRGQVGQQHSTTARLIFEGTQANPASFTSIGNNATMNCLITNGGFIGGGLYEADWTNISKIGRSGNQSFSPYPVASAACRWYMRNCLVDQCGRIQNAVGMPTEGKLEITNNAFTRTLANSPLYVTNGATSAQNRWILDNKFDKLVTLYGPGILNRRNLFAGGLDLLTPFTFDDFLYNVICPRTGQTTDFMTGAPVTMTKVYLFSGAQDSNPHPVTFPTTISPTVDGAIVDTPHGGNGDGFTAGSPGQTYDFKKMILLPTASGNPSGKLVGMLGGSGTVKLNNSTIYCSDVTENGERGGINIGETATGEAVVISEARNNLIISLTGQGLLSSRVNQPFGSNNIPDVTTVDYNVFTNPVSATSAAVKAFYGSVGGHADVASNTVQVRVYTGTTGSFTLLCSNIAGNATAETVSIAYNASGSTLATAVRDALNTLSDGTYAVSGTGDVGAGAVLTVTRNAVALNQAQREQLLRVGSTNTTGKTVSTTRPWFTISTSGLGANDRVITDLAQVDRTRSMATFDSDYLGNNPAAWANGVAYVVGDLVQCTMAGRYFGRPVNFRCIANHTSVSGNASTGQPGAATSTSWGTNWQFASLWRMGLDAPSYNPAVRSTNTQDLYDWVAGGQAPTNASLKGTGYGGADIGAVPVVLTIIPPTPHVIGGSFFSPVY